MPSDSSPLPPPADDVGFDCLLEEILADRQPPSQKDIILRRLRTEVPAAGPPREAPVVRRSSEREPNRPTTWRMLMAVAVAIALIVGLAALRPDNTVGPDRIAGQPLTPRSGSSVYENLPPRPDMPELDRLSANANAVEPPSDIADSPSDAPDSPNRESRPDDFRPTQLPIHAAPSPAARVAAANTKPRPEKTSSGQPESIQLVSRQIGKTVDAYWKDLSIRPTAAIGDEAWRDRVAQQIGARPDSSNLEELIAWIRRPENSGAIARRWAREVLGPLHVAADKDCQSTNLRQIQQTFTQGFGGDELIANWIADPKHPLRRRTDHAATLRLASVSLDADLRCLKCHDGWNHVRGQQSDYWDLVALVRGPDQDTFFETPDGRQRLATPSLPAVFAEDGQTIDRVDDFAASRRGSRRVAGGLVDSLWRMVHGRSLRASTIDFQTATDHDAMETLRQQLIDDLLACDLDLSRSLALILDSKTNRRSLPKAYQSDDWWMADRGPAQRQIETFAAAAPRSQRGSLAERIAFNLRRMGRTLDDQETKWLAQIDEGDRPRTGKRRAMERFWDYPDSTTPLPTTWLLSIDAAEQQLAHLAYLRGNDRIGDALRQADREMRADGISDTLRLQRLWWLMK
ncbi:MAG: hypothetical protein AAF958_14860 [Planctomycetota bacterium]